MSWGGGVGGEQSRFTFPSSHPPLPAVLCLSSVQLWLCDAKLMGARLSSIHTLTYNARRLIPTHTNVKPFSLSLTDPVSSLAGTHMHPPTFLPSIALSFPSLILHLLV